MQSSHPLALLVEDEPGVGDLLCTLLEQTGYRIEIAADGLSGQARIREGGITLLVLGRQLPVAEGLRLCAWVRAHEGPVYLPIVVLTRAANPQARHVGFVAGADDYFTPPFEPEALRDHVAGHLRIRRHGELVYEQQRGLLAQQKGTVREAARTIQELLLLLLRVLDGLEEAGAHSPLPAGSRCRSPTGKPGSLPSAGRCCERSPRPGVYRSTRFWTSPTSTCA